MKAIRLLVIVAVASLLCFEVVLGWKSFFNSYMSEDGSPFILLSRRPNVRANKVILPSVSTDDFHNVFGSYFSNIKNNSVLFVYNINGFTRESLYGGEFSRLLLKIREHAPNFNYISTQHISPTSNIFKALKNTVKSSSKDIKIKEFYVKSLESFETQRPDILANEPIVHFVQMDLGSEQEAIDIMSVSDGIDKVDFIGQIRSPDIAKKTRELDSFFYIFTYGHPRSSGGNNIEFMNSFFMGVREDLYSMSFRDAGFRKLNSATVFDEEDLEMNEDEDFDDHLFTWNSIVSEPLLNCTFALLIISVVSVISIYFLLSIKVPVNLGKPMGLKGEL